MTQNKESFAVEFEKNNFALECSDELREEISKRWSGYELCKELRKNYFVHLIPIDKESAKILNSGSGK